VAAMHEGKRRATARRKAPRQTDASG
jgi:hypothetical protein